MKKFLNAFVWCFVLVTGTAIYVEAQNTKSFSIGEVRELYSNELKENRILNIYLPQGYNDSLTYPVIYLLDGSMDEDIIHIAGLVQFMGLMYTMPPTIVVGIANVDRKRDFTFHTEVKSLREKYPSTGHSAEFISFLEKELIPFVEGNYAVGDTSTLIGQSLGGLLAAEIVLKKPHLFSRYFVVSPSLWWGEGSLLEDADELIAKNDYTSRFIHIAVGKNEEKIMVRDAKSLYKKLKHLQKSGIHVSLDVLEKHNHATVLHEAIYRALCLLFVPIA